MLTVVTQPNTIDATTFTFVVPGHQRWVVRSVRADVARAVGGAPTRAYLLEVTDGTTVVASAGAADAGTEPGSTSITWCDAPASATTAGPVGIVVASFALPTLEPGYVIRGTVVNPVFGDAWSDAVVWVDYANLRN